MKQSVFKISLMALALAAAVACGKKKNDSTAVNGRDLRGAAVGTGGLPNGTGTPQGTEIRGDMEAAKVLASGSMDPQLIGTTIQYVDFAGQISVDRTNGAVQNTSYVQIAIFDNYEGGGKGPIVIRVGNGQGTAFNGNVNMNFTDEFGTITVNGNWNNQTQTLTGTVSFANKKAGYQNRTSGTLGSFSMPVCSFFVCQ